MMIGQIWVAQCDVCGKVENAKITLSQYNEEGYTLPNGWGYGRTEDIHLCPECCKTKEKVIKAWNRRANDERD